MMTRSTIFSTMFWNSSSRLQVTLLLVQTAARPTSRAKASALMTDMICGM